MRQNQLTIPDFEDAVQGITDARKIMDLAAEHVGNHLNADRAGYAEIDETGEYVTIKTDWTSGKVPSLKGRLKIDEFGPKLRRALSTGQLVSFNNHLNSTFTDGVESRYAEINNRACIKAPMMRNNQFKALFFVHQSESRTWTENEKELVKNMADRTWEAVQRARNEEALTESEEKYQALFNATDEGMCIVQVLYNDANMATDHRIIDANPAFSEHTGLEDPIGNRASDMMPNIEQFWNDIYGQVVATGQPYKSQEYSAAFDRWFEIEVLRFGDQSKQRVANIFRDITNRQRQKRLKEEQAQLLKYISSGDPVDQVLSELCESIQRLNPNARASILVAEANGRSFKRPIAPAMQPSWGDKLADTPINGSMNSTCSEAVFKGKPILCSNMETDDRWGKEWRRLCMDNDIMAVYSQPAFNPKGQTEASFMLCFNEPKKLSKWERELAEFGADIIEIILQQKRSQHQLQESEEHYRALFNSMREGYEVVQVIFNENDELLNYKIIEANPAAKQILGREDIEGKPPTEIFSAFDDSSEAYEEVIRTREPIQFEKYLQPLDRYYSVSVYPYGKPKEKKAAVHFKDITEQKRYEKELEELNETLEERVEQRTSELVSYQNQLRSLAMRLSRTEEQERDRLATELHDNLGQMLAVIKMNVQNLQKNKNIAELTKTVELIDDSIRYTRELMSELKPPPSMKEETISAALQWVINSMDQYDLNIHFINKAQNQPSVNKSIQATIVKAVRELLFNTVKHADANKANVALSFPNHSIKVAVSDNGKGFEPNNTNFAESEDGRFGLFHLSERIDILGGQINIHASPGKGTEVILTVPQKDGKEQLKDQPVSHAAEETQKSGNQESSSQTTVLLVDDHEIMGDGLRRVIDEEDELTVIDEAEDAESAIEIVEQTTPDVVVMDINLPGMNGIEATKIIKDDHPQISVIGLSFHDNSDVSKKMYEAGASAYLAKSDASQELCALIKGEINRGG